jgi:hypothetical protein
MYFVFMYENRIIKPVEVVLRSGEWGRGRTRIEGVNLIKICVSTYVNATMYPQYKSRELYKLQT